MNTPETLLSFQKRFSTERRCLDYLMHQRWPQGFVCPKCHHQKAYPLSRRRLLQCQACRYQVSVTAGTLFHKTRTSLRKWFWMIFLMSHNKTSVSILSLQKLLGLKRYRTAWLMAQKIREAMAGRDARYQLTGLLEMDDAYFGAKKVAGKRGRGADKKSSVVVSVQVNAQNKPGYAGMQVVPTVNHKQIGRVLDSKVSTTATIKTDGLPAYSIVEKEHREHQRIVLGDPKRAGIELPWVHILIANCKGILRGVHHGVSAKHLQRYLSEFCYRFNRRTMESRIFERLIVAALSAQPITLPELRA